MEIPVLKPATAAGSINSHTDEVIARMQREGIEEADFCFNAVTVRVRKNSLPADIVDKWCYAAEARRLGRH